jgi:hypothetical protein
MPGYHGVTISAALWRRLSLLSKDVGELRLETAHMFHRDVTEAGYRL